MRLVLSLWAQSEAERVALALGFATMAEQARSAGNSAVAEVYTAQALRVLAEEPVSLVLLEHAKALAHALRAAEATGRWKERPRLPVAPPFKPEMSESVRATLRVMADQLEGA